MEREEEDEKGENGVGVRGEGCDLVVVVMDWEWFVESRSGRMEITLREEELENVKGVEKGRVGSRLESGGWMDGVE